MKNKLLVSSVLYAVIILLIITIGVFWLKNMSEKKEGENNKNFSDAVEVKLVEGNEEVPTIPITIEKLMDELQKNIDRNNLDIFQINDFYSEETNLIRANEFKLTENIMVSALVDKKSGKIKSAQLVVLNTEGTEENLKEILLAITIFIGSVDESLTSNQRIEVMTNLGVFVEDVDITNTQASYTKKDVVYEIYSTTKEGIWLTAYPKTN